MITLNAEADARVSAAHQRLRVRATTLRADWQKLQTAWCNALTTPIMIGSVAVLGAVMGARSRSPVVERKRVNAPPSFLRLLLVAVGTSLLKEAIAALTRLVAGYGVPPAPAAPGAPAAPSAKVMTPGVAAPDP